MILFIQYKNANQKESQSGHGGGGGKPNLKPSLVKTKKRSSLFFKTGGRGRET